MCSHREDPYSWRRLKLRGAQEIDYEGLCSPQREVQITFTCNEKEAIGSTKQGRDMI